MIAKIYYIVIIIVFLYISILREAPYSKDLHRKKDKGVLLFILFLYICIFIVPPPIFRLRFISLFKVL
jgi:hypothetical protein